MKQTTALKDVDYHLTKQQVIDISNYFLNRFKEIEASGSNARGLGKTKSAYLRSYYLTIVAYFTGRRQAEIIGQRPYNRLCGVRPEDINQEDNTIRWHIAKKNTIRSFKRKDLKTKIVLEKMNPVELATLKAEKDPYIVYFPAKRIVIDCLLQAIKYFRIQEGQRIISISRNGYDLKLKEACKKLGIRVEGKRKVRYLERKEPIYDHRGLMVIKFNEPQYKNIWQYKENNKGIGVHILRHSFAMTFIDKNKDDPLVLQKLQKILLHTDQNLTAGYLHTKNENLRENIEKI